MYAQMMRVLKRFKIEYKVAGTNGELRVECFECLKHNNKSQDMKLYIYCGSGIFICYRCNWKGKVVDLSSHIKSLYGDESGSEMEGVLHVPSWEALQKSIDSLDSEWFRTYTILPVGTMFAEESEEAMQYLLSRGIAKERIQELCLLYTRDGYFSERVIIPITNRQGNLVSFIARTIHTDVQPKYRFPKGCRVSEYLFNAYNILQSGQESVWITEGVFDAIHCYPHAVATFGKHITDQQIRILRSMNLKEVVLMWDWDAWHDTPKLWEKAISKLRKNFRLVIPVRLSKPKSDPTDYPLDFLESMVDSLRPVFSHLAV